MQSCFIFCYATRDEAEKCFNIIVEKAKEEPVPLQCYLELAEAPGVMYPFWVGLLFSEWDEAKADKWLTQMNLPSADEVCCGVPRATEFNLYSRRIKVVQFWKGKTFKEKGDF
jgi:hypothetical protein